MAKSNTLYLLEKSLRLGLNNIWRNKVLSLATIFVTATILFIFNIILAVNFIANSALTDLNKKIDLTVYLKDDTTYEQAQIIIKDLNNVEGVANVTYTSKQDALEKIKSTHPDISLTFEKYNLSNPLPASIDITTSHPKYQETVNTFLQQDKYQIYLSNVVTNENTIISSVSKNLLQLTNFTQQIIFWLILTFILGGSLIIINALQITIFSRKKEISVMKLVGASNWFIRLPFLIESTIYGTLAVILSFIMLFILSGKIKIAETSLFSYIFLGELVITILLSIFSATVAIHEHLQKDIL